MQLNPTSTDTPIKNKAQETKTLLHQIKNSERSEAPVTLWLAYRYGSPKKSVVSEGQSTAPSQAILYYKVRRLDIDEKLQKKLRGIVNKSIESAKRLEEYTFEGALEEETALYEETSTTEFAGLLKLVTEATEKDVVTKELHLNHAYAYLIELQPKNSKPIYAFRKLSTSWKARKMKGLINALLRDNVLVTFEDENVFKFEYRIDFFASGDYTFILEKGNFEKALYFREGMERKRDELLADLEKCGLYDGLNILDELSKTHVRWLKKLAGAHKHGRCVNADWIKILLECCEKRGWDVTQENGKLKITDLNCERLLRLMNYDLLESPVDHLLFNIDGAKTPTS